MKLFRTGSPAVVAECEEQFNFMPLRYQIDIRTVKFLFNYTQSTNSICMLFASSALSGMNDIFVCYGDNLATVHDLINSINERFLNLS